MNYEELKKDLIKDLLKCKSFEDINIICSQGVDISYDNINEEYY